MGNAESTTAMASVYGTTIREISGLRKMLRPKASTVKVNSRLFVIKDEGHSLRSTESKEGFPSTNNKGFTPFCRKKNQN